MSDKPTPYIGFSNDTLNSRPYLRIGDSIDCPHCGGQHQVVGVKDENGKETDAMLSYKCGGTYYMAGINGRNTIGVPSDVSGEVGL